MEGCSFTALFSEAERAARAKHSTATRRFTFIGYGSGAQPGDRRPRGDGEICTGGYRCVSRTYVTTLRR